MFGLDRFSVLSGFCLDRFHCTSKINAFISSRIYCHIYFTLFLSGLKKDSWFSTVSMTSLLELIERFFDLGIGVDVLDDDADAELSLLSTVNDDNIVVVNEDDQSDDSNDWSIASS